MLHLNCESATPLFKTRGRHSASFVDSLPLVWNKLLSFTLGEPIYGGIRIRLSPAVKGSDVDLEVEQANVGNYGQLRQKWSQRGPITLKHLSIRGPQNENPDDLHPIFGKFLGDFGAELVSITVEDCYLSGEEYPLDKALKPCPKLQHLDISEVEGEPLVSDEVLRNLPASLETLQLYGCQALGHDRFVLAIMSYPNLSSLKIVQTMGMKWSDRECEIVRVCQLQSCYGPLEAF